MKEIGAYFELELKKGVSQYHDTSYVLKSGRASLRYILDYLKPGLVYIPFYTCDALLEPFKDANINYEFYHVNEDLEPETLMELKAGELILYVNYFGLKGKTVNLLSEKYKNRLIVDCTQAFFMKGNNISWFFNSCRKFFGIPDGSYLYCPEGAKLPEIGSRNESYIIDHLLKRFNGHASEGYEYFLQNEILAGEGISYISKLSEYLLSNINYEEAIKKRQENYSYLHDRLKEKNLFNALPCDGDIPMCYPLLIGRNTGKTMLFASKIFIPSFWRDTNHRNIDGFDFEKSLTDKLWPLPVDQRYSLADMEILYESIINFV